MIIIAFIFITKGFSNELKITNYKVKSSKVNDNIKIAVIADLHSCSYGDNQLELLDAIDKETPDIVVLVGDIIDDDLPIFNSIKVIKHLNDNYKSYYVTGNHEYKTGCIDYIKDLFNENNIKVLDGKIDQIEIKNNIINISGVDDYFVGDNVFNKQLYSINENIDYNNYSVLLSHRPEHIDKYKKYDFDLIISGHAHGGQWRIPGLINGVLAPNQGLLPKYAGGLYNHGKVKHVVSRGLAKESTRFIPRIYNRPELVIISIYN